MRHTANTFVFVVMLLLVSKVTVGGVPQESRKAEAVLDAAEKAMRKLKSTKYECEWSGIGAAAGIRGFVRMTVEAMRLEDDEHFGAKFHISGTWSAVGSEKLRKTRLKYDGKNLSSLQQNRKRVILGDPAAPRDRMGMAPELANLLTLEFFKEEPLAAQRQAQRLAHEGRNLVAGVLCDIVYLELNRDGQAPARQRWYFSVGDHLPRRVEILLTVWERWGAAVTTLNGLQIDPSFVADNFTQRVPDGYTVQTHASLSNAPELLEIRATAPDWVLEGPEGREHRLSMHQGKLVLMDFWASWCAPCVRAMRILQDLHEEFSARGLIVVSINCQERSRFSNPAEHFSKQGLTYQLLLNGDVVARQYRVRGIPAFFLIDRDGKVAYRQSGFTAKTKTELVSAIKKHLKN